MLHHVPVTRIVVCDLLISESRRLRGHGQTIENMRVGAVVKMLQGTAELEALLF